MYRIQDINPLVAQKKLAQGAVLIDVREEYEIEELAFKMDNQVQVPMSTIQLEHYAIPKDKEIIIACKAGIRSVQVADYLVQIGYDDAKVFNLEGGLVNWLRCGLAVE